MLLLNLRDRGFAIRDLGDGVAGGPQVLGCHAAGQVQVIGEQNPQISRFGRWRGLRGLRRAFAAWVGSGLGQLEPEHAAAARPFDGADASAHATHEAFADG